MKDAGEDSMEKKEDNLLYPSERLNVSQIMTKINEGYCVVENESAKKVLHKLCESNYTMAPVKVGGLVKKFVRRKDLEEKGIVSDYSVEIDKSQLISCDTELLNLIDYFGFCLENDPFFFILKGNSIVGFVLPADFNKQPAHLLFFILFSKLEIDLKDVFQKYFKDEDEWLKLLSKSEKEKILRQYKELQKQDLEISKLECTQLKNLLDVIRKDEFLLDKIGVCSKKEFKKIAEDIRHFRDLTVHPINKLVSSKKEIKRLTKTKNSLLQFLKNIHYLQLIVCTIKGQEMKDAFDQWLDEEEKKTKQAIFDKVFHGKSPFARLFNRKKAHQ